MSIYTDMMTNIRKAQSERAGLAVLVNTVADAGVGDRQELVATISAKYVEVLAAIKNVSPDFKHKDAYHWDDTMKQWVKNPVRSEYEQAVFDGYKGTIQEWEAAKKLQAKPVPTPPPTPAHPDPIKSKL